MSAQALLLEMLCPGSNDHTKQHFVKIELPNNDSTDKRRQTASEVRSTANLFEERVGEVAEWLVLEPDLMGVHSRLSS